MGTVGAAPRFTASALGQLLRYMSTFSWFLAHNYGLCSFCPAAPAGYSVHALATSAWVLFAAGGRKVHPGEVGWIWQLFYRMFGPRQCHKGAGEWRTGLEIAGLCAAAMKSCHIQNLQSHAYVVIVFQVNFLYISAYCIIQLDGSIVMPFICSACHGPVMGCTCSWPAYLSIRTA